MVMVVLVTPAKPELQHPTAHCGGNTLIRVNATTWVVSAITRVIGDECMIECLKILQAIYGINGARVVAVI